MPEDHVNREEIRRRRDRLFDLYGQAPVTERHKSPPPGEFEEWIRSSRAGYVGSAYALVRRPPGKLPPLTESMEVDREERESVLLIKGRGGTKWGVPGGGQEGEETYEETATREIEEETGVGASITDLSFLRHEVATVDGYDEVLHVLRAFFLAEYESGSISIQPGELTGATWFVEPPDDDRLMPGTERLLADWDPPHR